MAKKIKVSEEELKGVDKEENVYKKNYNLKFGLKLSFTFNIIFFIVILVVVSICNNRIQELNEYNDKLDLEISSLKKEDSLLKDLVGNNEFNYIKQKLNFFDENIVFEISGREKYYYSYDCMQNIVDDTYTFLAYNKEQAQNLGLMKGNCK